MRSASGDWVMTCAFLDDDRTPLPPPEVLREDFARGDLQVMGEIAARCASG